MGSRPCYLIPQQLSQDNLILLFDISSDCTKYITKLCPEAYIGKKPFSHFTALYLISLYLLCLSSFHLYSLLQYDTFLLYFNLQHFPSLLRSFRSSSPLHPQLFSLNPPFLPGLFLLFSLFSYVPHNYFAHVF